jgi:hypothetical protein
MITKEDGHSEWITKKVTETMRRVDSGETSLLNHEDAMKHFRDRINAHIPKARS